MIIQIRGTSGSGKTTAMRELMEKLGDWEPQFIEGRKRPLYYRRKSIVVLGHYGSACGGCDNLSGCKASVALAIDLAKTMNVLMEGRLVSDDVKHTMTAIDKGIDVRCLVLATDPDTCVERIIARRKQAGNDKPFAPSKCNDMNALVRRVTSARRRLEEKGVVCRRVGTKQAVKVVLKWLKEKS